MPAILIPHNLAEPVRVVRLFGDVPGANTICDALQTLVGGYFELLQIPERLGPKLEKLPGCHLWINEDGKRLELPMNSRATDLCLDTCVSLHSADYIAGNAVISCGMDMKDVWGGPPGEHWHPPQWVLDRWGLKI